MPTISIILLMLMQRKVVIMSSIEILRTMMTGSVKLYLRSWVAVEWGITNDTIKKVCRLMSRTNPIPNQQSLEKVMVR